MLRGLRAPAKWFRTLLSLVMVLVLCAPAFAAPASADSKAAPSPKKGPSVSAIEPGQEQATVEADLEKALSGGGQKTFLVTFKGQADVNGASTQAKAAAAKAGKTPAGQRLAQANAVINSLKQVAEKGQKNVVPLLKQLQKEGSISEFEPFWVVNMVAVTGDAKALKALAARPEVEKIAASKTYRVMGSKTGAATQDGGSAQSIEWNIQNVNAPQAWSLGIDGTGIVVANLDTGVEGTHPALARKYRGAVDGTGSTYSWFDAVNNNNSAPYDDHGHGTHTMGTIVGSDQSGANMIGVAPGATWISAKILSAAGSGTDVDIIAAAEWMLAPGGDPSKAPDVISNSWGGGSGTDEWLRPTVQAWRAAGIVPVFANGNTGAGETSCLVSVPANYPESIGVAAVDINNKLAGFSCRGPSPYGEVKPELSAPGVGVRSAVPGGGYEGGWNGTSMATPHVAGVAAMLRQVNASLTVDDIEQILLETAVPLTDSQYASVPNNGYGWGLVNAFDAVSEVLTGRGTLTGRVITSGDDIESPVITHTAATSGFAGFSVPLTAQVSDNVSLTEVNLYAKWDGDPYYTIIPMTKVNGDHRGGTYTASIPGYLVQVPSTKYYIRALDYGNNPASTATFAIAVSRGLEPGYFTDLEMEPAGWQHGGDADPWQWGAPTSGPMAAHSGQNLYATNLAGNYAANTNAYLATPPIYLADTTTAILQWYEWYDLENNYDWADVWVLDAAGGQTLALSRTGTSNGWKARTLDLTPWAGQSILVLFNLDTDGSVQKAGWYLDDIALVGPDSVAPAAPTGLAGSGDALGAVNLTWSANAEADMGSYRVYRSPQSGTGYSPIGSATTSAFVDSTPPNGATSYYVVSAVDLWGNESTYSNEVAVTVQGPTVIFFDDMEAGDNGWTHGGTQDQWQRGTPTSGPMAAFSGVNLWATNLAGTYNNSANAWLMSPAIALPADTSLTLRFAHWYELETNWDKGYVEISTNGTTWTQVGNLFTGTGTAWSQPSYDLSAYAGQTIRLRFRMTSDGSVNKLGWYIDDFKIVGVASVASDGAFVPTKEAMKREAKPLYMPEKSGSDKYPLALPGTQSIGIMSLPADATVTVLETGRSVRTNPATGGYTLSHAAGSYTARADAYGFYPVTVAVSLPADGVTTQNFLLEPMPSGTLTGTVTNARTGEPLEGVTVRQMEDSRVGPVTTGADGSFSLTLLEGTYTLMISIADFKPFTASVTVPGNGTVEQNVALEPFIGFPGEFTYDDGTAENALAYYDAGNGWAVRMTPDTAKGAAMLKSASFFFWDTSWPTPGGTSASLAVFDSTGAGGAPGQMLAGPIPFTAVRGAWNTVDLAHLGLSFEGDFYVAYIQAGAYPNVPGLATDESGPWSERSWGLVGGQWAPTPQDEGNYMIRASVLYEVAPPSITSPANDSFTNQATVNVTGTSVDGATVTIYNDGAEAGSGNAAGGTFSIPVALHDGANVLTATATVATGTTRPSAGVTVTLDQTAPDLTVTSPAEDATTNREAYNVTGTASDQHLSGVTVNGEAVTVTDGAFDHRILLNPGENVITVVAADIAGNSTTVTRTLQVDLSGPQIRSVMPDANVTLHTDETLTIAFDSHEGLTQAGFRIVLFGTSGHSNTDADTANMTETAPGHYEGIFTAPAGTSFSNATITVWARDASGNYAEANATGRLTVVAGDGTVPNEAPTASFTYAPAAPRRNQNVTFTSTATDADGTIVTYIWDFGDGTTGSGKTATTKFKKAGTYTVTLTVIDNQGATGVYSATVTVR
jgi:bacillopeptidase F (M6 metalloprotease family)/subtilisin family serine protease